MYLYFLFQLKKIYFFDFLQGRSLAQSDLIFPRQINSGQV